MEIDRELFLEDCAVFSESWNKEDTANLKDFFTSDTGRKILGILQLRWKETAIVGSMKINPTDPYAAAAALAENQGRIRGIITCIDRLMEWKENVFEPPAD